MGVDGSWRLVVRSPMGGQRVTVVLCEVEGGGLSGTLTNDANGRSAEIFDGAVSDEGVAWKVTLREVRVTLAFGVTVEGDSMQGRVRAGHFGRFAVAGQRVVE